jgi:tetratricopeptide (TPR) repeat protein
LLHAQQLAPNNATVNELLSRVLLYMGRGKEAERVARHSIEIDPLTFKAHENLARILFAQGRFQDAGAEGRKAAEIQPNASASRRWQVFAALMLHDDATAIAEAHTEPAEGYRVFELALAQTSSTDRAAADDALKNLLTRTGLAYQTAQVYAWRGDADAACEWLQRAYDQHDTGILSSPFDLFLQPLHSDARYQALRKQLGLPDPAW